MLLRYSGWVMIAGQHAAGYHTPYDNTNGEWLILDNTGLPRFGINGGTYLPISGEYWHFLHRDERWRRFKVGDGARTRETVDGLWEQGDLGHVVKMHPAGTTIEAPISWKRERDGLSSSEE